MTEAKKEEAKPIVSKRVFLLAVAALRLVMLIYGEIQDRVSDVKYTDVDY
jgi:hypothetical protein